MTRVARLESSDAEDGNEDAGSEREQKRSEESECEVIEPVTLSFVLL